MNIDWEKWGSTVIDLYEKGFSAGDVARQVNDLGLKVTASGVHRFLVSQLKVRNIKTATSLSYQKGKRQRSKVCDICGRDFIGAVKRAKYCVSCIPNREAGHRFRHYRLTNEQYELMLSEQQAKCFLCDKTAKLVVDHDHKTSKVRGLLCYGCNVALGHFELAGWASRAHEYILRGKK